MLDRAAQIEDREMKMKLVKRRKWTDEETALAKEFLIQSNPSVWNEILKIESQDGNFIDQPVADETYRLLHAMHKECEGTEIGDLWISIRRLAEKEIRNS